MDGFPADHPSRLQLLSAVMERMREHVCHDGQICRERFEQFMASERGRRLRLMLVDSLTIATGAGSMMPPGEVRQYCVYWFGLCVLL